MEMKKLTILLLIATITYGKNIFAQSNIDIAVLDTLLKTAEKTQTDGLVIYHEGKLYGEYYFGKEFKRVEAMSSTKSIVNFAIGKLVTDGLITSIDQPVYEFYPEWKQGMKKDITIRHLLTHTSGMQNFPSTSVEIYPSPNFINLALAAEITDKPGTKFSYNNKAVNLLGGIVKLLTRKRIDNYLYEKIFEPMGIEDFDWTDDQDGNPHCMSGFQVQPKDLAKLGQLFIQKGNWNGKQLINADWFTETGTPNKLNPECGLLWWIEYKNTKAIIDDEQINKLRKIGFDEEILKKVNSIKGTYASGDYFPIFNAKIVNTTANWSTKYVPLLLSNGLQVSRKEFINIAGYSTRGFLGNYMIVYPDKNLVVVRMISWDSFTKGEGKKDGTGVNNFENFFSLTRNLVK
jgi:CubicO group peptidase (beta-lactamase class C family)